MKTISIIALSVLLLAGCATAPADETKPEMVETEAMVAPPPDDQCDLRDPDDGTCLCKKLNAAGQCVEGGGTVIIQGGGANNLSDEEQ